MLDTFYQQLTQHELKFGINIQDKTTILDVAWPQNVLRNFVFTKSRSSLLAPLTRSRTSLQLKASSLTGSPPRRRSVSPDYSTFHSMPSHKRPTLPSFSSVSNTNDRPPIMAYDEVFQPFEDAFQRELKSIYDDNDDSHVRVGTSLSSDGDGYERGPAELKLPGNSLHSEKNLKKIQSVQLACEPTDSSAA